MLAPYGIEAQHPDDFVRHLMSLDWGAANLKRQGMQLRRR